ncbi:MAG: YbjN domain-containing protein [Sandaracinaceae bacterium]|jgi:hypothetical protein|nr:YbjN domain-containing protein [Sandaracinaceae bacterium]
MSLTFEQLGKQLDALGWPHRRHDAHTYRCDHKSREGELHVYVRLSDHWLVASVVPFLGTKGDNSFELVRWLLRQNRDLYQARFSADEDGDIVLSVELPTESLDPGEIQSTFENLLRYAVEHRATLRRASGAA